MTLQDNKDKQRKAGMMDEVICARRLALSGKTPPPKIPGGTVSHENHSLYIPSN